MAPAKPHQPPAHDAQAIAAPYIEDHDVEAFAPDVTYRNMGTGETYEGRDAVESMLQTFYEGAFEGSMERTNVVYADDTAVMEFTWRGTHVGEFAGIPATGKSAEMPCCLVMEVGEEYIERARLYPSLNRIFDAISE